MSKIDTLISLINYQRQHPKGEQVGDCQGCWDHAAIFESMLGGAESPQGASIPVFGDGSDPFFVVRT